MMMHGGIQRFNSYLMCESQAAVVGAAVGDQRPRVIAVTEGLVVLLLLRRCRVKFLFAYMVN